MQLYIRLILIFLKLGLFTFGGGYAMIPLIQEEIVKRNGWLDNRSFLDIVAVAQCLPGALAVNTAVFVGYRIAGVIGALCSAISVIIPSFIVILVIALFFTRISHLALVRQAFLGIRPAVVVLIAVAVYRLAKEINWSPVKWLLAAFVVVLIKFLHLHPVVVIIFSIATGFFIFYRQLLEQPGVKRGEEEC